MSDYVKSKVLRYPITDILNKFNKDIDEIEKYFKQKKSDFEAYGSKEREFTIGFTDSNYYLDYVLEYKYGSESGDYGYVWELSQEEKEQYRPLFEQLVPSIDMSEVHKVVYCYYNGTDCPDYYKIID